MKSLQIICSILACCAIESLAIAQKGAPQKSPSNATIKKIKPKISPDSADKAQKEPLPVTEEMTEAKSLSTKQLDIDERTKTKVVRLQKAFLPWSLTANGQMRPHFAAAVLRLPDQESGDSKLAYASLNAKGKESNIHLKGEQQAVVLAAYQKLQQNWQTIARASHVNATFRGLPLGRQHTQHTTASLGVASPVKVKGFGLGVDFSVFGIERNESSRLDAKSHRIQSYSLSPSISYRENNTFVVSGYSPGIRNEQDGMALGRHGVLGTQLWQTLSQKQLVLVDIAYWRQENFYSNEKGYLEIEGGTTMSLENTSQLGIYYLWRQKQVNIDKDANPLTLGQERISISWHTPSKAHRLIGATVGLPLNILQREVDHRTIEIMLSLNDVW